MVNIGHCILFYRLEGTLIVLSLTYATIVTIRVVTVISREYSQFSIIRTLYIEGLDFNVEFSDIWKKFHFVTVS
jgi:hypothetical protein